MAGKPRVALVIGSGGLKCAAALGLYKALSVEGIQPDMIVGCSGGSVMGALIALGDDPKTSIEKTLSLWTRERMTRFSPRAFLKILMPRLFGFDINFALTDDKLMLEGLEEAYGKDTSFDDLQIPMHIIAADAKNGAKVVLSEGRLVDAIRASMGIPLLFGPHCVNDQWLVDGGIADPLPIDVAIRENVDLIIAMGFESSYYDEIGSLASNILQMTSISINNLTRAQFAFYNAAHHAEIISMMMRFDKYVGLFDTHLLPYIIEEGERTARQHLPYIQKLLEHSAE